MTRPDQDQQLIPLSYVLIYDRWYDRMRSAWYAGAAPAAEYEVEKESKGVMSTTQSTLSRVVSGFLKSIARLTRSISDSLDSVVDFAYARVFGLPFIVLGYRQTGKTTLLERLQNDLTLLEAFAPEPTAAGGDPVAVGVGVSNLP